MKILDDFLPLEKFLELEEYIFSEDYSWKFTSHLNDNTKFGDDFQLVNYIVRDTYPLYKSAMYQTLFIMEEYVKLTGETINIINAKSNCFIKKDKNYGMGMHLDIEDIRYENFHTLIYYVNSNNGGTRFINGDFIESKANRALIVDGSIEHESVIQTDELRRILFNINFTIEGKDI